MTGRRAGAWAALALFGLVGCSGVETYHRRLRVPLAGDAAGDARARACFTKCSQRGEDYRIAMCLRGCPAVQESEGACTSDDAGATPDAGCFTWKTEGRMPNVPEPPRGVPGERDDVDTLVFGAVAGAAFGVALGAVMPDLPDDSASGTNTGRSPPSRSRPAHAPARPRKR